MSDHDYDYQTKVIEINANLPEELKKLEAEGWQLSPGAIPFATYHLRKARGLGGRGGISIDESKVYVVPASANKGG